MASGPVPSVDLFRGTVTKPECFAGIDDAIIATVLDQRTGDVVSAFGDRATPPILSWDSGCDGRVIALAARSLMGYRGYKKDSIADAEYVAMAKEANDWLELVAAKRRHPIFVDSTSGNRPDTPLVSSSPYVDSWIRRHRNRCCT